MNERKVAEAVAAEIERAEADGDYDRAQKLADLLGRIIARISRHGTADSAASINNVALPDLAAL